MIASGLLYLLAAGQVAAPPKLVGVLSVTEGKVRLERAGANPRWAGRFVRLRVGDRLTVVEPPKATVWFSSTREVWRLPAAGSFAVGEAALRSSAGAVPSFVYREVAPRRTVRASARVLASTIRGSAGLISPMGAVRTGPIRVGWTLEPGTSRSVVELLDAAGKRLWTQDAARTNSLTLPSDRVKPGAWFLVRVTQRGTGGPVVRGSWVRLMTAAERKALESSERQVRSALAEDPVARGLALGELLASSGLISELADALAMVFPEYLAKPEPSWEVKQGRHTLHGEWLEAAGFGGLALGEYERAWEAGARDSELKASIERLGGKAEPAEWEKLAAERDRLMDEQKFADALPLAQRVVELLQKEKPGSVELGEALTTVGDLLERSGRLDEAERVLEQALEILERVAGPGSMPVARALRVQGSVANGKRDLLRAQQKWEASLAIYEKLAPDSRVVATLQYNLGIFAHNLGALDVAQRRYEAALAIFEKLAPGSLQLAMVRNNLGLVARDRGDLEGAQRHHESALAIRDGLTPGSVVVARSLFNIGNVAYDRGDLDLAQRHHEAAFAIREKLAPRSRDLAESLNSLGAVAWSRGNLEEAQRRFEAALAIEDQLAPRSLAVAACLANLGSVAWARGDLDGAQRRYEAALAIFEKLAPGSLNVATSLNNLGSISSDRGDLEGAQRRFEVALEIQEKLAPGSLDMAASLTALGVVAYDRGDLREAQRRYEAALAIFEELAPGSLTVARSLSNLGNVAAARGDEGRLGELHQRRLAVVADLVRTQGLAMTGELGAFEAEATRALNQSGWLESPQTLYSWLPTLRAAGLTLQTRAKISERAVEVDEDVRKARSAVEIATKQETDWVTNPRPTEMPQKEWDDQLLDRRAKRQSAELALSTLLQAKDPRLAGDLKVKLEDIQKSLAKDTVLVEFLRVSTWDEKARKQGPDAYGAFHVAREGEVRFVRLGDAKKIGELVDAWHVQVALANDPNGPEIAQAQTERELRAIGRKLHDRLIRPLGALPPNVLIAPDAALHSLPFGALVDRRGRYLVETTALSVVASGRDLVERPLAGETSPPVVMAAPAFGADAKNRTRNDLVARLAQTRAANAKGEWDPLAGALSEGKLVAEKLSTPMIAGEEATEERLLGLVRPRVLHIATHGFFFGRTDDRRQRENTLMSDLTGRGLRVADNPMLRSGLVMAGANQDQELIRAGLADGWATALEVSLMDLRGTELVVLSACDTGRGEDRGAEGVFGLQRAFRFAGAQSVILSLFKVPDDSTRGLMEAFYGAWKPGDPAGSKLNSLRAAQLSLLRDRKTRHPRHWSAFVLIGDR